MRLYRVLTVASLKMYFRNRAAIFWALFFPTILMVILGLMNFDRYSPPSVGVVDNAQNDVSAAFISAVNADKDPLFDVTTGTEADLREDLRNGDQDAVIIIPENFGVSGQVSNLQVIYDSTKPQQQGLVSTVVDQTLDSLFKDIANVPDEYLVESRFAVTPSYIEGEDQGYGSFLVPGIAAMAIMQSGIFGVVFSLIRFKTGGVLRRLKATPIGPSHFLVGQMLTRLLVTVLQTYVLIVAGMIVLQVSFGNGSAMSWVDLTIIAIFGGALFNTMGLAISGWAKSEDVAAPVANIISLPMMFLSGVFFPVDALPDWLASIAKYFPLTYLADGLREITSNGATLTSLGPEMLGLAVWTVATFVVATWSFRWE